MFNDDGLGAAMSASMDSEAYRDVRALKQEVVELRERLKTLERIVRHATSSDSWPAGIVWRLGSPPEDHAAPHARTPR